MNTLRKYTVIGVFPEENYPENSYVEWVMAESPTDAVTKAFGFDGDRAFGSTVVAVFEGHRTDLLHGLVMKVGPA